MQRGKKLLHEISLEGIFISCRHSQLSSPSTHKYHYDSDYASSASLIERVGDDLHLKKSEYGDLLYSLYLDDGKSMAGRTMRYASGVLVDKQGMDKKEALMEMNDNEIRILQEENTDEDPPALKLWNLTPYQETSLPSVDSAVVQFPSTNGIVSALVLQYRVSLSMYDLDVVE